MIKEANKYIGLKRLYEIRESQYRGADRNGMCEYYPDSVDEMIRIKESEKSDKETERMLKEMEEYENQRDDC